MSNFLFKRVTHRLFMALCITFIAIGGLLAGCSSKKVAPSPFEGAGSDSLKWVFETGAIELQLKTDSALNSYNDRPHTLVVIVYQLKEPTAFDDLTKTDGGVLKLLGCSRFDPSVTATQRIIIQPSEGKTVVLDRAEGSQYVGVVAGYYSLNPLQIAKVFRIPINTLKNGWIFKTITYKPAQLKMEIILGAQQIENARDLNQPPDQKQPDKKNSPPEKK